MKFYYLIVELMNKNVNGEAEHNSGRKKIIDN